MYVSKFKLIGWCIDHHFEVSICTPETNTGLIANQMTNSKEETFKELQSQHKEINIKINRLEERYIEEEVGSDLYKKYSKKYSQEKSEIERNLMSLSSKKSNLEKCVDLALEYAVDLPLKWVSADYHTKQQMQILLFPQGISYSKKTDESRTTMINSVFLYIAYFQQLIGKKKRGIPELSLDYASFADSVAGSRIELLIKSC